MWVVSNRNVPSLVSAQSQDHCLVSQTIGHFPEDHPDALTELVIEGITPSMIRFVSFPPIRLRRRMLPLPGWLLPVILSLSQSLTTFGQLRLQYPFDPGTITHSAVQDVSGNALDGQIVNTNGGLTSGQSGAFGEAIRVSGGDIADGMILLPPGHVPSGNTPRTFSLWFQQSALNGQNKMFGSGTGTAGATFDVGLESGGIRIRHFGGNITYGSGNDFLPTAAQAGWHHLAVRVNTNATTFAGVEVFLDAVKLAVTATANTGTNQTPNTTDTTFGIGNTTVTTSGANNSDFDGFLDEFQVYQSALPDAQIATLAMRPPDARALEFYASPGGRVPSGSTVALRWMVSDAASVDIMPDVGKVTALTTNGIGAVVVNPLTNTTYTLTVTGTNGNFASRSVVLSMGDTPFPNLILYLLDDFGWADWQQNGNPHGSVFFETPTMNRLAQEGRYFPNAYASTPVCSPTRGAILSGQSPARNKLTDWIAGLGDAGKPIQEAVWTKKLGLDEVTIAEVLQGAGYRTVHVGKWHLGNTGDPEADPRNQGFDVNIGGNHKGNPGSYYFADASGSFDLPNLGPGSAPAGTYLTDHLTFKANEQISQAATQAVPFFLYFAHYAVHTPLVAPAATVAKYQSKLNNNPGMNWQGQSNPTYAAMIEHVDLSLSNLLQRLDDPNADANTNDSIAANTLVLFFSDNGGLLSSTSNRPLRTGKGYGYEGGIREPMIAWWPGRIAPGTEAPEPVICYDFYPTLLHVAGVAGDPLYNGKLDGQDLSPLLFDTGSFTRQHPLLFHYPHYSPQGGKPVSAARLGEWKLLHFYEDDAYELYDLATDVGESQNRILVETNRTATMSRTLVRLLDALGAHYPRTLADVPLRPTPRVAPGTDADGDRLADTSEDSDGDGLVGPTETDPDNADTDNDTTPDGAEVALGTHPRDPASTFRSQLTPGPSGQITLTWPSLPGPSFELHAKTNAIDTWTVVESGIPASAGTHTSRTLDAAESVGFYRIQLEGY